jgi:molybdopterin molybdotransferase
MTLLSVAEAHARLMQLFGPVGTEVVPLGDATGRILARDVLATRPHPPFATSAMDGYAIRLQDAVSGAQLAVVGMSAAGARFEGKVGPGEAVRIFTGAPVPDGADMILIQEDADRAGDTIAIRQDHDRSGFIRPMGADFDSGAQMTAPRRLGVKDIALLAAMNAGDVTVARRPRVALIPTGDELVMPGETPDRDQIIASNNFALKALLESAGAEAQLLPIARDTPESLEAAFALAAGADAIVTLGGASVGDFDIVQATALAKGLSLEFYRVAMRPGQPLMVGRFGTVPLVGLPGNPVSAIVCGHIFLKPAVERMLGFSGEPQRPLVARLGSAMGRNGPRAHYMRALVEANRDGWCCTPFPRQDSALLSVLTNSNALLVREPHDPERKTGQLVEFIWI